MQKLNILRYNLAQIMFIIAPLQWKSIINNEIWKINKQNTGPCLITHNRCVLCFITHRKMCPVWLHTERCVLCLIKHTDVSYVLLHIDRCFFFLINPQKGVSYDWLHTKRSVLRLITHKKMCPMFDYTQKDVSYDWLHTKRCVVW
jgi:hypothetical protein